MTVEIKNVLARAGWFQEPGMWAVVDGQFGSTGKGLAAAVLAECFGGEVDVVTTNAGPNSGHTSYVGDEMVVLQQLPTFAVVAKKLGVFRGRVQMNAGSVIDIDRLNMEERDHGFAPFEVWVHPNAAVVTENSKGQEAALIAGVGSTGKGTGAAIAAKVMREKDAVASYHSTSISPVVGQVAIDCGTQRVLMEVSQGFSLSLNAESFYPFTTSRDCTVAQAMADAGLHPHDYRDCMLVVRTFPIRVAGNSGPCYDDQEEITWGRLGVAPEQTTVTKKTRRVFTWSKVQFMRAVSANRPRVVFLNFVQYLEAWGLHPHLHDAWIEANVIEPYTHVMGHAPDALLLGYGPRSNQVQVWGARG
jgi:adenylosuccinate synthase